MHLLPNPSLPLGALLRGGINSWFLGVSGQLTTEALLSPGIMH